MKKDLYEELIRKVQEYAKNGGEFNKGARQYPFASTYRYLKSQPKYKDLTINKLLKDSGVVYDENKAREMEPLSLSKLKFQVEYFIANGGDITMPMHSLPFYNLLRRLREKYNVSNEEIFKMADINLDREYETFVKMTNSAKNYIKNGKLNLSHKNGEKVYVYFQEQADRLGISYYEYLAIITNLPANKPIIRADYLDALRMMLYKKFPSGEIDKVKAGNKTIYYKIKNIRLQHRGQNISTEEVISMLGFVPKFDKPVYVADKKYVDEEELVRRIKKIEKEDGQVTYKKLVESELYKDVLYCSYDNNIGVYKFMQRHNIKYKTLRFKRLETITMPDEFKFDIYKLKQQKIESIDNFENLSNIDRYYKMLSIAKEIHEELVKKYTLSADELEKLLQEGNEKTL
ncbi:MAG: hypothetical protein IJT25_01975 [Clostridia bacterium]|nr:hypothetical protein [Clostridia bacterium]